MRTYSILYTYGAIIYIDIYKIINMYKEQKSKIVGVTQT
jgi:hypothetical protein